MTVQALHDAGGVAYLRQQAHKNPGAFLALIAKCIPLQIKADVAGLQIVVHKIEVPVAPVPGVIAAAAPGFVPHLVHDAAVKERESAASKA